MWIILIFIISGIFCILKVTNLHFNNTTPGNHNSNIWKVQVTLELGNILNFVNLKTPHAIENLSEVIFCDRNSISAGPERSKTLSVQ